MIRVGDLVSPFFNMNIVGTVVSFEDNASKNATYTTGGTTSSTRIAIVELKAPKGDNVLRKFKVEDLLKANM